MIRVYLSPKHRGGRSGADVFRDVLRGIVKNSTGFSQLFERVIAGVTVSYTVMSGVGGCLSPVLSGDWVVFRSRTAWRAVSILFRGG